MPLNVLFQSYPERLLAFYLAYRRGAQGYLMEEFKKKLLPYVTKHKNELFAKYLAVHPTRTIPSTLRPRVKAIYDQELTRLKKELT